MAERYNFKYLPLVGKLPGKSMVEQTETAINELASVVYDNVGHVGNLAEEVQTANTNASNALNKATEALETSGRVYIKQIAAVDVNDYYDSELYYINNDGSTNIPVRDRGFLEVKTNDDKTACEQVFIADSTGTPYYRHGRITEQTLGEETTYVVTWSSWYRAATTEYVQGELTNYLPLSGGTMTGDIIFGNNEAYIQKQDESILGYNQFEIGWGRPETSAGTEWRADGAKMAFHSYHADNTKDDGAFAILATDGVNNKQLNGNPSGDLTWNGKNLDHTVDYSVYKTAQQFTAPTIFSSRVKDLGGGYKKVGNIVYVYVRFRLNTTLAKGGWGVLNNFPTPYNMGFSDDYRIPLIATAWYGDNYSGNVSSAFMDSDGAIWLITNGQMESTNKSNYFIYVYGTYYAE